LADINTQDGRIIVLGPLIKRKAKMEEFVMIEFTPQHYAACFVQEKMKLKEDGK